MQEQTDLREQNEQLKAQLEALSEVIAQRDARISRLESQLNELLRRVYGRSSERLDPSQLVMRELLSEAQNPQPQTTSESSAETAPADETAVRAHTRKPGGRMPLPEHLKRNDHYLDIEAGEKICRCCGKALVRIGEEVTERLSYRPTPLEVNRYIRPKYACGDSSCDGSGVKQAEPPAGPIARCEAESNLVAHIIKEKFEHHNPLYRQEIEFARRGVPLVRTTMSGWCAQSGYVMKPLWKLMIKNVLGGNIVLNDDTPVDMLEPGHGKTRTARLWCTVGGEHFQYIVYNFTRGRGREGPEEFFKDYRGYFVADGFGGYDRMFCGGFIIHVACWAHARRYFVKAQESSPRQATAILVLIAQLYRVESDYKHRSVEERLAGRQKQSVRILEKIKTTLQEQRASALPKSALGEAIDYSLRLWEQLCIYTTDGRLPIDNNLVENAIRPVALGRKNWLFVGSENGGHTAAVLMSFCATCRRLNINTWEYLTDVLQRINDCRLSQLEDLLPDNWQRLRTKAL